ncbi:hypothetical protein F4779DRAFT_616465 [Xylariaceae sp. FL0662B]|nr:hypothetical protein F4779DRAFT_616465 [Xylariaceae sp. FL0662B]
MLTPWQLCFQKDLKCRARGCTNKRILCSAASSPYCKQHVCAVYHRSKNCLKRGRGDQNLCDHHGCIHGDCMEPRAHRPPDRNNNNNSPYCARHRCADEGCDQRREEPGLGCRRHTCHDRNCANFVPGHEDPKGAQNYCDGHRVCQARACRAAVFNHASNPAGKYCFEHFCDGAGTGAGQGWWWCDRERVAGGPADARACREHSCRAFPGCAKPRAAGGGPRALYCADHECAHPGCRRQRHDGDGRSPSPWCPAHMCLAAFAGRADCVGPREATPDNPLHCADHRPCEVPGCGAFRARPGQSKCEDHLRPKCTFPACARDAEDGTDVCRHHVCRFGGCQAPAEPTALVCAAHKCGEPGCPNPRMPVGGVPSAPLVAAVGPLEASGALPLVGQYCYAHTCRARGCMYKPVRDGTPFCAVHTCRDRGCYLEARAVPMGRRVRVKGE